jgi:hypothetical protein
LKKIKYVIEQKSDHPAWLFAGFWLLTLLFYCLAYKGGFYEDFVGFLEDNRHQSYMDIITKSGHAMYFGVNTFQYVFIHLFGSSPFPWFLLFTSLHAVTALLLVQFFRRLFVLWKLEVSKWVILFGVLLWLLTPLAVETVNWKACSHYMCSMIMMFAILNWFIRYMQAPKAATLICILLVFTLSTVFLEFFFLTPIFALILLITAAYCKHVQKAAIIRTIVLVWIPMLLIIGLYFVVLYALTGRAYDHVEVKAENVFDPLHVASRLNKYIVHIYFMEYFLPGHIKFPIYRFIEKPVVSGIAGVSIVLLFITGFISMRKASPAGRMARILFILFITSFIVILPMWFFDLFTYQGSRYYYLASSFGYMLLSLGIFSLRINRKTRMVFAGTYLGCCMAGTLVLVKNVRDAERVLSNLMESFTWGQEEEDIFLLDLPIYYRGIGLIGAADQSNFQYHLDILKNRKVKAKVYDVSSFNMTGYWDGVHIQVEDSTQLKVIPNQFGCWWWYKFQGAMDYENEKFKVTFINDGFVYLIRFKQPITSRTCILFQSGGFWKKVDMHKKGDQW